MSTHISQIILNKIDKEHIKPRAKWYFVMKHAALWIPGVLVTGIGAVAVAGELYAIAHSGWEFRDFVYSTQTDFVLAMMPIMWIISFVFFGSLIVKALRTTHAGYRFSVKTILLVSVATSIILGVFIYATDEIFEVNSVIRYPVQVREQQVWFSPNEGRLSGIIENKIESDLKILDKDNTLWTIDMSGFGSTTFPYVAEGKSIRIIGTSTGDADIDDHIFIACAVFPWDIGEFAHMSPASSTIMRNKDVRILNRMRNNNPDCKIVIDNIKQHVKDKVNK